LLEVSHVISRGETSEKNWRKKKTATSEGARFGKRRKKKSESLQVSYLLATGEIWQNKLRVLRVGGFVEQPRNQAKLRSFLRLFSYDKLWGKAAHPAEIESCVEGLEKLNSVDETPGPSKGKKQANWRDTKWAKTRRISSRIVWRGKGGR